MRRETMVICVLVGLVIGMGALLFQDRTEAAGTRGYVIRTSSGFSGSVMWTDGPPAIALPLEEGDVYQLAQAGPRLLLEDEDGGRAVVGTYHAADERLVISDIRGLQPARYPVLIARHQDGTEELLPISLDVSLQ